MDNAVVSTSWIEAHPVTKVPVDSLVLANSPRLGGEDQEHVRTLAESGEGLPPIIVHRPTMRVIDGAHRVRAALLKGRSVIDARLLDCDEAAAFVLAVKANVTHGLPLSQADRAAAAARIIMTHPQWSDRAVAAATALSDKTVSRIRARSTAEASQSNARLGRDGRVRPLNTGHRRQQAAAMIRDRPEVGLREVARATGLSPATVRDVRQRINRGEDPVPARCQAPCPNESKPEAKAPRPAAGARGVGREAVDRHTLLAKLSHDPSLRLNESGRHAIRWLYQHTVDAESLEGLLRALPDHWAPVVATLARNCSEAWAVVVDQLQARIH